MSNYQQRLFKVLDYIDHHLDDDLSVDCLSRVACLSKFHFHRQFSLYLGMTVSVYVTRLKLKRASYRLAFRSDDRIIDIALANGYDSAEAFSRAFKRYLGQSPSGFRRMPQWYSWQEKLTSLKQLRTGKMQQETSGIVVDIIDFEEMAVGILPHRGNPALLGSSIRTFIDWRKANHLHPSTSRTFNLVHDDPGSVDPDDYRLDLCAEVRTDIQENPQGVIAGNIPAGRCAVVRHVGPDEGLDAVIRYLYTDWLDQSNEELRDFPLFLERIKLFPDVPEHEMVTDIYLPLA